MRLKTKICKIRSKNCATWRVFSLRPPTKPNWTLTFSKKYCRKIRLSKLLQKKISFKAKIMCNCRPYFALKKV